MPICFLCGTEGPVRQTEVVTSRRTTHFDDALVHHGSHHNHHTSRITELKPLCGPCIANEEAAALAQLETLKKATAVGVGIFGVVGVTGVMIAVMPIALCLLSFVAAKYFHLVD